MARRTVIIIASILAALSFGLLGVALVARTEHSTDTSTTTRPIPTLPTGQPPAPGRPPVHQELSARCTTAVAPLRALAVKYRSGLVLDAAGSDVLTDGLTQARTGCSAAEYQRFYTRELHGWLTPGS